jgi:squalene-hopene/tetraprenyl-beta-curcumene cyclase
MKMYRRCFSIAAWACLVTPALAQNAPARAQTETEKKALAYLVSQQEKDGAWLPQVGPGATAMVVKALVQSGRPITDPVITKALQFIESTRKPDGGYYKDSNPNYNSAIVLSLFATLDAGWMSVTKQFEPPHKKEIEGLQAFLKSLQQDESKDESGKPIASVPNGKPITKTNSWYGGAGYGEDRPDLSNTAYFIEALHESGLKSDDPAIQKALTFVSRAQMLGETNDLPFAKGAANGGFIYTPVNGGESKFGDIDRLEGGSELRSYGTMTYSGFKSLLYAGLTEDDPRVKAAIKWITANWTLDYNAGSGGSLDGKFYYFHAFSKAMKAWNRDEVTDSKGVKHNWRNELTDTLKALQKPDGSFVNETSPRWLEGNPVLATAYAVLALQEAGK